jgi:DNA-directed RNA polymerase subunit RPC12/RpoP
VNPFALGIALGRTRTITCPHCGAKKLVDATPKHHRVCKRCKKQFPDPATPRGKKKRG